MTKRALFVRWKQNRAKRTMSPSFCATGSRWSSKSRYDRLVWDSFGPTTFGIFDAFPDESDEMRTFLERLPKP